MHWKIAAAQIAVTEDIQKNLDTVLSCIADAAKKKANIICFPEISLIDDDVHARRIPKESRAIQNAAAEYNIHVICGSYVVDDTKRIRNQIWVVDRSGKIVMRYNKRNLYKAESSEILPGKRNKPFELDGVRCAIINCWDYAFPEEIRNLAVRGAEVIFCPSYLLSHPRTKDVLDKIPQARAFDAMSYFVMVDAFAEQTYKRSKICHPLHELAAIRDKVGIIYADIDTSEIAMIRAEFRNLKGYVVHEANGNGHANGHSKEAPQASPPEPHQGVFLDPR